MSMGNMSILLSVYPYYSVLVSDTFLLDATYRLSSTFLYDATGKLLTCIIMSYQVLTPLAYK